MKVRLWTVMYIGAVASFLVIFIIIYAITASGDASIEWIIWVFFGLTVALVAGGFLYESRYKRKQGVGPVLDPLEGSSR